MPAKFDIFKVLPLDIWYSVKDYLHPADVENVLNSGSALWKYIFKDETWLNLAKTHDRCLPLLIGRNLSDFRPRRAQNHLYCALIASDYSGDLRQYQDKFFACLRDGWVYNKHRHEISFQSGLIINIHEVITGHEAAALPLEQIFSEDRSGLHLEYTFCHDHGIKVLSSQDIIGLNGPAYKKGAIKHGCSLKLLFKGQDRQCILEHVKKSKDIWAEKWDKKGMIASWTERPGRYTSRGPHFLNYTN
ncbi:uncharacterized protein BDW43DRAFT_304530 [Aspergillus alliaceus]|uniref:uncharacterized protein n=1 Tax=Petromyces alliaceus TaxID=209559 RepID=UPI0012A498A1|nr:uncharacterized protein BDW43DRAFT_304530 [Aspergillus alliaceus]KAB8227554.1 hypothetical protein BDW43DRAFT_304530 [Aspergillus alliaceus]